MILLNTVVVSVIYISYLAEVSFSLEYVVIRTTSDVCVSNIERVVGLMQSIVGLSYTLQTAYY